MITETATAYLQEKVPSDWFDGQISVRVDSEEILVTGALREGQSAEAFREATREARISIASEAEAKFHRAVSWGVERDGALMLFTNVALPVMTRLRLTERAVLDTLVDGGVARSRSEALAWCVKLVGRNQEAWLAELRTAIADVESVRAEGPSVL
jgi:hypothetical protein